MICSRCGHKSGLEYMIRLNHAIAGDYIHKDCITDTYGANFYKPAFPVSDYDKPSIRRTFNLLKWLFG